MISIGSFVEERVQKIQNMAIVSIKGSFIGFVLTKRLNPFRIICFICHFLQNFNLIIRCLKVMWRTFHDLNSNIISVFEILRKPDSGEMTPAEFLHQDISVDEDFSDMAGMIASNFIVFDAFVLTVILFVEMED